MKSVDNPHEFQPGKLLVLYLFIPNIKINNFFCQQTYGRTFPEREGIRVQTSRKIREFLADLTIFYYFVFPYLKNTILKTRCHTIEELRNAIENFQRKIVQ